MEAFNVPMLKKEIEKIRLEAEESKLAFRQLEEKLNQERLLHVQTQEQHQNTLAQCKFGNIV